MSTKIFYFASKYAFSDNAVDALRESFQRKLQGPAPFVAYDRHSHLFSLKVDHEDDNTPIIFFRCMRGCIEQQKKTSPLEVPTITPKVGMTIENELRTQPVNAVLKQDRQGNGLLDIGEHVDDTVQVPSPVADLVRYWPSPEGRKDRLMIPSAIIRVICSATGSHITEEPDLNRWRIDGANASSAFNRLQRLVTALEHLEKPVVDHILVTGHTIDDYRLEAQPLSESRSTIQRLMNNDPRLYVNLTTTKLRLYSPTTGSITIPINLSQDDPVSGESGSGSLWTGINYRGLGTAYEMLNVPTKSEAPRVSGQHSVSTRSMISHELIKVEGDTGEHAQYDQSFDRVLHWTQETVGDSDPNKTRPSLPIDKAERTETASERTSTQKSATEIAGPIEQPSVSFDDLMKSAGDVVPSESSSMTGMTFEQLMKQSVQSVVNPKTSPEYPDISISDVSNPTSTNLSLSQGLNEGALGKSQFPFNPLLYGHPEAGGTVRPLSAPGSGRGRGIIRRKGRAGPLGLQGLQSSTRNSPLIEADSSVSNLPQTARHWDASVLLRPDVFSWDTFHEVDHVPIAATPSTTYHPSGQTPHEQSDVGTLEEDSKHVESNETTVARTEALHNEDEVGTRTLHSTMRQKAPKKVKKLTEAEKDKILQEAWGIAPKAQSAKSEKSHQNRSSQERPASAPFAKGRQRIMTDSDLTRVERLSQKEIIRHASTIRESTLLPVFQGLQFFSGNIQFQIQVGQILSELPQNRYYNHFHTAEQWKGMFAPSHAAYVPKSQFSKAVTTNGADIQFILDVKGPGGLKLFQSQPFNRQTQYEFHCQTKSHEAFVIHVSEHGTFVVRDVQRPLSITYLHFAAQIWDGRVVVAVESAFSGTDDLKRAIKELIESIYIEADDRLNIIYRRSESQEVEVVSVLAKRTTLHRCLVSQYDHVRLQITEVQRLKLWSNDAHPDIWLARSGKSDQVLVEENRLHHEVSLSSESIDVMLETNETMPMEDDHPAWDEKNLITHQKMDNLMVVTELLIRQIDRVGCLNNIGTETKSGSSSSHLKCPTAGRGGASEISPSETKPEIAVGDSVSVVDAQAHGKASKMGFW